MHPAHRSRSNLPHTSLPAPRVFLNGIHPHCHATRLLIEEQQGIFEELSEAPEARSWALMPRLQEGGPLLAGCSQPRRWSSSWKGA